MQLTPFVRRLYIQTSEAGDLARLEPNWAQRDFLYRLESQLTDRGRARLIVLKARQLGLSTITEASMFALCFFYERYRGLVIAHEAEASQHLLSMTQTFWDTFPFKSLYSTKYEARNMLTWSESMSQLRIATAKNTGAGRSRTIDFLHASEVGFWLKGRTLMTGLSKSIHETPGTVVVLESTANGRGNYFHEQWEAAVSNDTEYVPLFYPWHLHPEYSASFLGISTHLGSLTEVERVLRRIGVDDDHLAWRRYAIRNLCGNSEIEFMQEYPTTPEEAFITTGTNVFPADSLRAHYAPTDNHWRGKLVRTGETSAKFVPDPSGPLTIYAKPSNNKQWGQYIIGGDPSRVMYGDYAVAQVLNRRTMEQVAVWRGHSEPGAFATELVKLGYYYNEALVCPEKQGAGYMTIGKLLGLNYPNIIRLGKSDKTPGKVAVDQWGWDTNVQTKNEAIGWLLEYFTTPLNRDAADKYVNGLLIHDRATYSELCNYISLEGGGYGNGAAEKHDDTVMSLAIAVTCHQKEPPLTPYQSTGAIPASGVRIKPRVERPVPRPHPTEIAGPLPQDEYADTMKEIPHFMRSRE